MWNYIRVSEPNNWSLGGGGIRKESIFKQSPEVSLVNIFPSQLNFIQAATELILFAKLWCPVLDLLISRKLGLSGFLCSTTMCDKISWNKTKGDALDVIETNNFAILKSFNSSGDLFIYIYIKDRNTVIRVRSHNSTTTHPIKIWLKILNIQS